MCIFEIQLPQSKIKMNYLKRKKILQKIDNILDIITKHFTSTIEA